MLDTKSMLLFSLFVSVLVSVGALADRKWPERVFDCQVVTDSGGQGLVSLQSFSLEDAVKGVVGLQATTLLGNRSAAARVVQCIEQRSGNRFAGRPFPQT